MTQYLLALHRDYAAPIPPEQTRQVWADVKALGEKLTAAGAFVFQGGMDGGPESATVVRPSGGDFQMTDGPYIESKEHLAGFWIIDAADLDEALKWAKLTAAAQQRPIEVRPLFDGDIDDALDAARRAVSDSVARRDHPPCRGGDT